MAGPHEPAQQQAGDDESAERSLLVNALALSEEQVAAVDHSAAKLRVSFAAALIELGLATSRDVELLIRAQFRQPIPAERAIILHPTARRPGRSLLPIPRVAPLAVPAPELLSLVAGGNSHTESLRSLRTEVLLRLGARDRGTALAIVSTAQGDGRTRLAAQLAISLAQLKRKVLLVDADLRRPRLDELLAVSVETPGLAGSLAADLAPECFQVQGLPTLAYIPSGTPDAGSYELFSDQRFHAFISGCCQQYDFVIVDTPATGAYADGVAIAAATGYAMLVLRGATTATQDARRLLEKLDVAGAQVLGAVLNHF